MGVIDDVKLVVSGKQSSRLSPLNSIVGDGNTLILKKTRVDNQNNFNIADIIKVYFNINECTLLDEWFFFLRKSVTDHEIVILVDPNLKYNLKCEFGYWLIVLLYDDWVNS